MSSEVKECLAGYLGVVKSILLGQCDSDGNGSRLRGALEQLERTKQFAALAGATAQAFERSKSRIQEEWEMRAATFLRLSGVYTRLADGDNVSDSEVFARCSEACQSNSYKITHADVSAMCCFSKLRWGRRLFAQPWRRPESPPVPRTRARACSQSDRVFRQYGTAGGLGFFSGSHFRKASKISSNLTGLAM